MSILQFTHYSHMVIRILHEDRKTWGSHIPFVTNRKVPFNASKWFSQSHRAGKHQNLGLQVSLLLPHAFPPQRTKKNYNSPLQKILSTVIQQLFSRHLLSKKSDFRPWKECRAQDIVLPSRSWKSNITQVIIIINLLFIFHQFSKFSSAF